jgi:predicted restriction endonuclease
MLKFCIEIVGLNCALQNAMQDVELVPKTPSTWEEIFELFKMKSPDFNVYNVSSNDQHPNNVLETQWIQCHVAQTKTCNLDERPDMKKV